MSREYRDLTLIIAAVVIGSLVGVFYGQTMWMATGGPHRHLERLEATAKQKLDRAAKLDAQAKQARQDGDRAQFTKWHDEAARLRDHVPTIRQEQRRTEALVEQADEMAGGAHLAVARYVYELSKFVGDLFLQVLKLLVIPLVVTSMICGITSLGDVRHVGRVGACTLIYYFSTAAVAVLIGILLVQAIQPGAAADDTFAFVSEKFEQKQEEGAGVLDTLLNVFRGSPDDPGGGMFPSNIFKAASETNVLALIVFAIVFGAALSTVGEKGKVAIDFFRAANEAVMKMVHVVMLFAPIGIYGLIASYIARKGGGEAFMTEVDRIRWYVLTVLIGLGIHVLVLGTLLPLLARRNPLRYTLNILRALLTAMSTASSSATLPVTMECIEENNGVSQRASSFVLPLGATINMDGTALYEAVAVIFIAQSLGMELATGALVVIFLTATLAAVGAAGIPEAGLVTMVIVLQAAGVPLEGVATILAVDWFLDRIRTTVNVYGDAVGAGVIDRLVIRE